MLLLTVTIAGALGITIPAAAQQNGGRQRLSTVQACHGAPSLTAQLGGKSMGLKNKSKDTMVNAASQFMDYFNATPSTRSLSSICWGASQVGPRDQSNGLEDKTLSDYVYWDGGIIKGTDGIYHMFASRWNQADGHNGWQWDSHAIHATSTHLYGPYTDRGLCWPDIDGGKGHNVTPLQLKDGRYAITVSGVRRGGVFVSKSLDGPWSYMGDVTVAKNAYSDAFNTQENLHIILRPDGRYEAVTSRGLIALADDVAGPYTVQGPSLFSEVPNCPNIYTLEDPCIWYSGGHYHFLTNQWDIRKAFHFTSSDGIANWKLNAGYAYDPTAGFIRDANGTVNHWCKLERPNVYIEKGHVVAMTFAAINVEKEKDLGNDLNGSKIIIVPFDGAALDRANSKSK
ncbi:MAG: glycoside hydrolase family protein [Capsulimonas sp.]